VDHSAQENSIPLENDDNEEDIEVESPPMDTPIHQKKYTYSTFNETHHHKT
jgi:hypothetical protein